MDLSSLMGSPLPYAVGVILVGGLVAAGILFLKRSKRQAKQAKLESLYRAWHRRLELPLSEDAQALAAQIDAAITPTWSDSQLVAFTFHSEITTLAVGDAMELGDFLAEHFPAKDQVWVVKLEDLSEGDLTAGLVPQGSVEELVYRAEAKIIDAFASAADGRLAVVPILELPETFTQGESKSFRRVLITDQASAEESVVKPRRLEESFSLTFPLPAGRVWQVTKLSPSVFQVAIAKTEEVAEQASNTPALKQWETVTDAVLLQFATVAAKKANLLTPFAIVREDALDERSFFIQFEEDAPPMTDPAVRNFVRNVLTLLGAKLIGEWLAEPSTELPHAVHIYAAD